MASLFKSTTTSDPIWHLLNAETEEESDKLTLKWKDNKLEELNFIGIVGALLAGVLTSIGSWPTVLPNNQDQPWTIRACWYCGMLLAIASVITAAQQAIRLYRLSSLPKGAAAIRGLLSSKRRDSNGHVLPRRLQVLAWQLSGWVLTASAFTLIGGMCVLIWAGTGGFSLVEKLTGAQWWNGEAKLAVTFSSVGFVLLVAFCLQQWTLFSWEGKDDSNQRHRPGRVL